MDALEECLAQTAILRSIDSGIKKITARDTERGDKDGWSYLRVSKSWFFEQTVTYAGSAQSVDLTIVRAFQLNRIEQVWNDATARDFSIRMYTDPSLSFYAELDKQTANTALNRIIQAGTEYKYPASSRLRCYYENTTAAKTCRVRVQVDEL